MIYICDDFFSDPYSLRSFAIKQEYSIARANYPGFRSQSVPESVVKYIEDEAKNVTKNSLLKCTEISFQSVPKDYREGQYHYDEELYVSVVFLSMDPPPNSGMEVYDSESKEGSANMPPDYITESRYYNFLSVKENFYKDTTNFLKGYKYARMTKRMNSYFDPSVKIPNKFNRFVIFNCRQWHRAQNFFGTSIGNSRLTLVSFFK